MTGSALIADIEVGTLIRSLCIAAVLVLPFGIHKFRQIRRVRAAEAAPRAAAAEPDAAALEPAISAVESLGSGGELVVPARCTIDGQPAPPELRDALLRDALQRSGLIETHRTARGDDLVIRCARIGDDTPVIDVER
jgi:hypothetical protein